jgi:hypothetical protein
MLKAFKQWKTGADAGGAGTGLKVFLMASMSQT